MGVLEAQPLPRSRQNQGVAKVDPQYSFKGLEWNLWRLYFREIMKEIFLFTILLSFLSCLESESSGGGKKKKRPVEPYSPAAPLSYDADVYAKEGIEFSYDGAALFSGSQDLSGYQFALLNAPNWLDIDSVTAELTGAPAGNGLYQDVEIEATKLLNPTIILTFDLAVNGDPLRQYAWHLNNTEPQSAFSARNGSSTLSINADPVYQRGITGAGVRVAVSDSGVEINHDDLYQNSLGNEHRNYSLSAPYYGIPTATGFHGTAVASLIAAKGWNNEGSMGVAPNADFAGFQFLNSSQSSSIMIDQASGDFDIFNYSYGDYLNRDTSSDSSYIDQLRYMANNGRGGLGSFFVKAAGNEFYGMGFEGCFSHNANAPFENESPYVIVVGAVNADGHRSTYSNAGSNLWVSAPGGEGGISEPAIIAADLPTCFKGQSIATSNPRNPFEYGHHLNAKCNYTSRMNGTSSAAPIVSGVIALILEQNPGLNWREVKHILAATAQQVDVGSAAWPELKHPSEELGGCPDYSLEGHVYEQGWVVNAAGYKFHNYYGFGLVDAEAAVAMAASGWKVMDKNDMIETNPDFNNSSFENDTDMIIPDKDIDGVDSVIEVFATDGRSAAFQVESVQVNVVVSHAFSGEVGVELTSPGGTKSILLNVNNSFYDCDEDNCVYDSNLNITLASHAFYGENAIGEWSLKVLDGSELDAGTLKSWKLNILGHNP